jgi:hypothetical protein
MPDELRKSPLLGGRGLPAGAAPALTFAPLLACWNCWEETPMERSHPSVILSKTLYKALVQAGVVRDDDQVTRVVIDAKMDHVVRIHVERLGDVRLLDVIPMLSGIEISSVDAPPSANPMPLARQWQTLATIKLLADKDYKAAGTPTAAERLNAIRRHLAESAA